MKRYIKSFKTLEDKRDKTKGYKYVLKHGLGPGTIPRDVDIIKIEDGDYYDIVYLDRPLTKEELKFYDIPPEWEINRYVRESTDIEASHDDIDYFGQAAAEKYGDMIFDRLYGSYISKAKDRADRPLGIEWTADWLGIDMWDLLEALEGMCHDGRAREVNDSTYLIGEDIGYDEDEEDSRYILVATKSVEDADGFLTDYTLYKDSKTGEFFCMFGDTELYPPDPDYADMEFETNESEARAWFEDYNGFADELYGEDYDPNDWI